jgi:hypothetical protein
MIVRPCFSPSQGRNTLERQHVPFETTGRLVGLLETQEEE